MQKAVVECAHRFGMAAAHFGAGMTPSGSWITATVADGGGFPDLVIAGGGRLLFVELKSAKGRLSERQLIWLDRLRKAGAEVHVFRPAQWVDGTIEAALRGGKTSAGRTAEPSVAEVG